MYRDLIALQTAGFPIYTERTEGKSLWSLLDTMKHHIPVPFTFPELMALYFGSTMLKIFKGTFFYDSLETLSQKNTEPEIGRNGEAVTFKRPIFSSLSGSPIHRPSVSYTTTKDYGGSSNR